MVLRLHLRFQLSGSDRCGFASRVDCRSLGDIVAPGGEWREFLLYSAQDQSKSTANPEAVRGKKSIV